MARRSLTDKQKQRAQRRYDEQRKRLDYARGKLVTGVGAWRFCGNLRCRRNHRCSGDAEACSRMVWAAMPEEQKEYWRGAIIASKTTKSGLERHRAGLAAQEKYREHLKRMAELDQRLATPPAAPAETAPQQTPPPRSENAPPRRSGAVAPRIRSL